MSGIGGPHFHVRLVLRVLKNFGRPDLGVILQGGPWYAVLDGLRQGLKQLGLIEESTLFWTFATLKEI